MHDALQRILARAFASAVVWVPRHGRIVHCGERRPAALLALGVVRRHHPVDAWSTELGAVLGEGVSVHVQRVGTAGVLVVIFTARSSLGLVRLAVRDALADVARLASTEEPFVPPRGGAPPSGAPAPVAAGLATWSAPLPRRRSDPS